VVVVADNELLSFIGGRNKGNGFDLDGQQPARYEPDSASTARFTAMHDYHSCKNISNP
jgi:hypothetical protein